jgi:hypothetical protein
MKKSKIIFLIFSICFFIILVFFIYDFSTKTTFPGSADKKPENSIHADSLAEKPAH